MAKQRARAFLEQLQKATYSRFQIPPPLRSSIEELTAFARESAAAQMPNGSDDEKQQHIAEFVRQMTETQRIATSYEAPHWYNIILKLSGEIDKAANDAAIPVPSHPLLGTLPIGQINAMTIRVPGTDEFVIIFDWQLFLFALLLSKAVVRALPLVSTEDGSFQIRIDSDGIRSRTDSDPSVVGRFLEVVMAYAVAGDPGFAPQYFPEPQYSLLAARLRDCMELFVMGHEYAHIILGHLTSANGAVLARMNNAEEVAYSWQQEYEADMLGANLMMRAEFAGERVPPDHSYWGADFFFLVPLI